MRTKQTPRGSQAHRPVGMAAQRRHSPAEAEVQATLKNSSEMPQRRTSRTKICHRCWKTLISWRKVNQVQVSLEVRQVKQKHRPEEAMAPPEETPPDPTPTEPTPSTSTQPPKPQKTPPKTPPRSQTR